MATVTIDGKAIQFDDSEGLSVLEIALSNGVYIPHLCHHPDLPDLGSCRLCLAEIDGGAPEPTCMRKAADGMNVNTNTDRANHLRNLSMELILAAHPEDCSTCVKYGRCEMQTLIQYMGVSATRMHTRIKGFKSSEQPLLIHDMNRCVLCGRCVRACNDLRGVKVLRYNKRDMETYVGTLKDRLLKDADCRFCGACAEVCPTGTIRDVVNYNAVEKRDALIPCQATCPAHADVPEYVRLTKEGRFSDAAAVIHEKIPFPECLGRVCAHPCEGKCRRGDVNEALSIRNIKRYAAEHDDGAWIEKSKRLPSTGKKVCVVGGGPSGMTAAFYLAKQGHSVTLKEANEALGGQMQYGIPSYRLPRETVNKEAGYLAEFGVKIEKGARVDKPAELLDEFDAVLMAIGTHKGIVLPMAGNDKKGVLVNTEFLKKASMGEETGMGKKVVVLGGGNVAFDCARTAKRLGAEEIHLACLEARENMLADDEEITEAAEEGIFVHPAKTFEEITGDGTVSGVRFMDVKSFTFDENRRAIIEKAEGSEQTIECDTVIFAVGQRTDISADAGLELGRGNSIAVKGDGSAKTSAEGIFACGDATYGTKTVIQAVASGREAAAEIDRYLGGTGDISETLYEREAHDPYIGAIDGFGKLARKQPEKLGAGERENTFAGYDSGLGCDAVCKEAGRCLQCDLRFDIKPHRLWSDFENGKGAEK